MFFKRKSKSIEPTFPLPAPPDITIPDLADFRAIHDFFTRERAQGLLGRLAAHQRGLKLSQLYVQALIDRMGALLVFAGELARAENLPEGDRVVLFLAVIYAYLTPAQVNPLFHTLINAEHAADEIPYLKYTDAAAVRVARAIKEYAAEDAVLKQRFLKALATKAATFENSALELQAFVHRLTTGVMERHDTASIFKVISEAHPGGESAILTALHRYFANESVYPLPSTPERWAITSNFVGTPSLRQMRLHSVGSPGGNDYDFAWVNVPLLKKRRIAIGSLELFINDTHAAAAIEARKTMDAVYECRPKLYIQWLADKKQARKLLEQGIIDKTQYNAFKAYWHRARGLPHQHYGWKAGNDVSLPPELQTLIPAREGGYNQIPLLLHDCIINPLPTLAAGHWTQGLEDDVVLDILTGAAERMNSPAAKAILAQKITEFETNRTGRKTYVSL